MLHSKAFEPPLRKATTNETQEANPWLSEDVLPRTDYTASYDNAVVVAAIYHFQVHYEVLLGDAWARRSKTIGDK